MNLLGDPAPGVNQTTGGPMTSDRIAAGGRTPPSDAHWQCDATSRRNEQCELRGVTVFYAAECGWVWWVHGDEPVMTVPSLSSPRVIIVLHMSYFLAFYYHLYRVPHLAYRIGSVHFSYRVVSIVLDAINW